MILELTNSLQDKELIASYQSAIRDAQRTNAQSLELIAESNELLKLIEQIDSPLIAPTAMQKSPASD